MTLTTMCWKFARFTIERDLPWQEGWAVCDGWPEFWRECCRKKISGFNCMRPWRNDCCVDGLIKKGGWFCIQRQAPARNIWICPADPSYFGMTGGMGCAWWVTGLFAEGFGGEELLQCIMVRWFRGAYYETTEDGCFMNLLQKNELQFADSPMQWGQD